MPKDQVVSPLLAEPNGHFAQATAVTPRGRFVFISGMTARNADGGITGVGDVSAQTHQVCQNLQAAVEAAGGTLDDIARVDVYVRDIGDFDAIHAVRREYFKNGAPASTMVEVSGFVKPEYLIEINAIAVVGD
jgi:enamine deaminase RidA (YjgF/YER057c/UK114 family)